MDEVPLKMNGRRSWLWRAVDQQGLVLDILVQERRNRQAAERVLRRVLERCGGPPRVIVTDKPASDPPAIRRVLPGVEHRRHKRLHKRAENSQRPTRRRERARQRLKSPARAQHLLSCFAPSRGHFCPRRHLLPARCYRAVPADRFQVWRHVVGLPVGA